MTASSSLSPLNPAPSGTRPSHQYGERDRQRTIRGRRQRWQVAEFLLASVNRCDRYRASRTLKAWLVAYVCVVGPSGLAEAQVKCPERRALDDNRAPHASLLCAALGVQDGRLLVRPPPLSRFYPSEILDRGKPVSEARQKQLERALIDQLAKALAGLAKLYTYSLTNDERQAAAEHRLPSEVTRPVETYAIAQWDDDATKEYAAWAAKVDGRRTFADGLGQLVNHDIAPTLETTTPLFVHEPIDAEVGVLLLSVADLTPEISDLNALTICIEDTTAPCVPSGIVVDRSHLAQILDGNPGSIWSAPDIHDRLMTYLSRRGFMPRVGVSRSSEHARITILESPRVTRILWSTEVDAKPSLVEALLSVLLSREDFAFYRAHTDLVTNQTVAGDAAFRQLFYRTSGPAAALPSLPPLLNTRVLSTQQARLEELALILTVQGEGDDKNLVVRAKPGDGSLERPASAPEAARPEPVASGTARSGAMATPDPIAPASPSPTPEEKPLEVAPRDRKHFIGAGVQYRPGQGVKPFVQYERSRLEMGSAIGSLSAQAGTNGQAFASGTGDVDYLFFKELHHRLTLIVNGGSDFNEKRILSGAATDERRVGGSGRVEYELLGGRNDSQLTLSAESRRVRVSLTPDEQPASEFDLSTADVGATFTRQNWVGAHPYMMRVEPSARFGWTLGANPGSFQQVAAKVNLNEHLRDSVLTTLDVLARVQITTSRTPLSEQPSLGGVDTLRGFRTDEVIGTTLWSVQPELWFELPKIFGDSAVGSFASKLRVAGFVDVGGVTGGTGSGVNEILAGPGVGLRLLQGPIALKIDWAYGLGSTTSGGRGKGRFYIGANTITTF
jgi:surface antigen Omp85-like protein